MPSYKIEIVTSADTRALQQTQQATTALTKSQKDLSAAMAEATQKVRDSQQPAVANAAALNKTAGAAENAGKKVHGLGTAFRQLGTALTGLPLAGVASIATVVAASIVLIIEKIVEAQKKMEKLLKDAEALRKTNMEPTRNDKNTKTAKLDADDFGREIQGIRGGEETPEQEGQATSAAARRKFAGARARLQGQKDVAMATIERREAAGELTPAAATEARLKATGRFDKEGKSLDATEEAELAYIARRVAGAEGGRAAQLSKRTGETRDELTGARNRRDDAHRFYEATLKAVGMDEDLKPVEGGRAEYLESEIKSKRPAGTWEGFPFKAPDAFAARQRLRFEQRANRSRAIGAREMLFDAERDVAETEDRFGKVRGEAISAESNAKSFGRSAREQQLDFENNQRTARDLAPMAARASEEEANANKNREAARLHKEVAKELDAVLRSLGDEINSLRGFRQELNNSGSQNKTKLQTQ